MSRGADISRERRRFWIVCACLVLVTLALYARGVSNGFVNYDDGDYVKGNAQVQAGLSWEGIKWAFSTGHASNWHPLTWLSHELDCTLFGLNPYGPHLINILLHAVNTLLVFLVLRLMTGAFWPSAFVAAMFGWHPVHVESVAWISERKDVLSTLFLLLTIWAYVRYAEQLKIKNAKWKISYAAALFFFICGLMSKPMLVTLPFVLLLIDYWPLERICDLRFTIYESKQKKPRETEHLPLGRVLLEKVPFLLLAVGSSIATFLVQQKGGAVASMQSLTVAERIGNAVVSYLRYAGKLVWPADLAVMYPHPGDWPVWVIVTTAVFLVGVSALAVWQLKPRPYVAVGWFWYVGMLVPVIGLVQVGIQSMADRYMYVPSIGLGIMLAWGASELVSLRRELKIGAALVAGAALMVCAILTVVQVGYWKDSGTLFGHVVSATKNNYLAYNNLGTFVEEQGDLDEALKDFQKAVEIKPNYDEAQQNLGHVLQLKGRPQEAYEHLIAALSIKRSMVEAHNNLGNVLEDLGHPDEAMHEYFEALHYRPDDADANNNIGVALGKQGKLEEAEKYVKRAVELKPLDPTKHCNLGNVYAMQNRTEEAIREYKRALELNAKDPQTRFNLGNALFASQRMEEAAASFAEALKLRPNNPEADYMLGLIAVRQGRNSDAITYFRDALRLRPNFPEAQRMLTALTGGK